MRRPARKVHFTPTGLHGVAGGSAAAETPIENTSPYLRIGVLSEPLSQVHAPGESRARGATLRQSAPSVGVSVFAPDDAPLLVGMRLGTCYRR
jgi:hypothetical protein